MGVQLGEIVPAKEVSLESLKGRTISIDAFNSLYQFLAIIRQYDGTPLMDSQGNITSHLSGLYYRTIKLMEAGIRPVYVFDGKPPELKARTIAERREIRREAETKWREHLEKGEVKEAKTAAQAAIRLTDKMVLESKELLKCMGVPVVQAPSEGEAQAAFMCSQGSVWAAGSQDFDALLFGSTRLLRNITITGRRKVPRKDAYVDVNPELIELDTALKELKITREKLIWLGMLVGTDFNEKVEGVGPKTALKLVQENDSFDDILKRLEEGKKKTIDFDYLEVVDLFENIPTTKEYELKWEQPDLGKIKEFLCEQHDFSTERVENAFKSLEQGSKGMSQARLDSWLGKP